MLDERLLRALDHLVSLPTESRTPNRELIDWVADVLDTFGCRVAIIDGPEGRADLLASLGPPCEGGVLLSGHTDVVPAGQGWASDPYSLTAVADTLVGRGTADMKGFIACALNVIEDTDRARLTRPIHVALSYDEEVGCVGVRDLLEHVRHRSASVIAPDLVLIGEPTMMRPSHAHAGKLAYRLDVSARAAHSSLSPYMPSAIVAAVHVVNALESIGAPFQREDVQQKQGADVAPISVNVGSMHGGTALNVLAERCEVSFELRHDASVDPDAALAPLWAVVAEERRRLAAVGGGVEQIELTRYPALATDRDDRMVRLVERAADRGRSVPIGYGTEGGLFAEAMAAPVLICGPGDIAVAHRPDEFVTIDQLQSCVRFLARIVEELCVNADSLAS